MCRDSVSAPGAPLKLVRVLKEEDEQVIEGLVGCPNSSCQREYPIIDGIPLLIAGLRNYIAGSISSIHARDDLHPVTLSVLGDCCGPGSTLDVTRQLLSSFGGDHYGEFFPGAVVRSVNDGTSVGVDNSQRKTSTTTGQVVSLLAHLESLAPPVAPGPLLDVGCGPGRSTFELARSTARPVLGVDMNYALLRMAAKVLRTGVADYPVRRGGVVYEQRRHAVDLPHAELVDFWACDATALPLPPASLGRIVGLNVLDSVASPLALLASLSQALTPEGHLLLACPYDWTSAVTPLEQWLGGHSQRSTFEGDSATLLRKLLTPGDPLQMQTGLKLLAESDGFEWQLRLHSRSVTRYQVHSIVAAR